MWGIQPKCCKSVSLTSHLFLFLNSVPLPTGSELQTCMKFMLAKASIFPPAGTSNIFLNLYSSCFCSVIASGPASVICSKPVPSTVFGNGCAAFACDGKCNNDGSQWPPVERES